MAPTNTIDPAIGVARAANCPDDFFVGPERVGSARDPSPPRSFTDGQCRVKRQAARFRIFAHHDDVTIEEITAAQADISWIVQLVNSKAAHPNRGNAEPASAPTIDRDSARPPVRTGRPSSTPGQSRSAANR